MRLDESRAYIYMKRRLCRFTWELITLSYAGYKMSNVVFQDYFSENALGYLKQCISLALEEDGPDLTAEGVFAPEHTVRAYIVAKEDTLVAGLPLIPLIFAEYGAQGGGTCFWQPCVAEGALVTKGTEIVRLHGASVDLLKLERVILNFISHLSGVANLTQVYVKALEGTGVRLLDTRKTLPGLRWAEKYAVRVGGGYNHRRNLTELLMLKDNHIDACGSILKAVQKLRATYTPCPPIEVECRNAQEVQEAVNAKADRVMLDNMSVQELTDCLPLIPKDMEAEISGGVSLENIRELALSAHATRAADFISVGRLTHSAPCADFSMRMGSLS